MPIDINHLRSEKGGNPDAVITSEKNRFRSTDAVTDTINLDQKWRKTLFNLENLKKSINQYQKCVSLYMKNNAKNPNTATTNLNNEAQDLTDESLEKIKKSITEPNKDQEDPFALPAPTSLSFNSLSTILNFMKNNISNMQESLNNIATQREALVKTIGNIIHPSVVISEDEGDNEVVRTWGLPPVAQAVLEGKPSSTASTNPKYLSHHTILQKIGGFDMKKGVELAGHRGYFLKGPGVLLNLALINYGLNFLVRKGYLPMQPPYFLKKEVMEETAELKDFEESLYHIHSSDEKSSRDDLYMIATSEQPLCAFHRNETIQEKDLPIKYAGISTCFRKEAGSHGKDTWGIFRVHQFEKVEQLCITTPEKSWEMHEEMTNISEEFYQSLGIPYRIVSIVSGALNDAAAKKYDLEAWFPGYNEFKELVSCSNCTDYQSRALSIYMGYKFASNQTRPFVHLLNGTLVATERCLCCILENYQTPEGVKIPEPLIPYVGTDFIKYIE